MNNKNEMFNTTLKEAAAFIDEIYALFSSVENVLERNTRLENFTALLLEATHVNPEKLEYQFNQYLPSENHETLHYIRTKIRKLNILCQASAKEPNNYFFQELSKSMQALIVERTAPYTIDTSRNYQTR